MISVMASASELFIHRANGAISANALATNPASTSVSATALAS